MGEKEWQEGIPESGSAWCFSPALRRQLTEKRLGLGLTYAALGRFFGVSWATVRKWELGKIRVCQQRHRRMVVEFLQGNYDQALREDRNRPGMGAYLRPVPRDAVACVQRFANSYRLLGECPKGRRLLVEEAQRTVRQVLSQLLKESLG